MTRIIVDNRIRVPARMIPPAVAEELAGLFTYDNPEYAKARAFGFRRRVPRTITTAAVEGDSLTFPRGGMARVRLVLQANDRWMRVEHRQHEGERWRTPKMRDEPYPFQRRLVDHALGHSPCLWRSPQASGKTMSALAYACELGLPTLVIVHTTNLLEQWVGRCREQLGSGFPVGIVQGKRRDLGHVTVGMQQTLRKVRPSWLRGRFGVTIGDEVQLFASTTFQGVIDHVDSRHVLGVSGDERRADGKEFLIYDQFGAVAAEVSHDELVRDGYIHEVEVRVVPTEFRADWYVELDNKQKVRRFDDLLEQMAVSEQRAAAEMRCVHESVADAGQAIVLAMRREHCHRLDAAATGAGYRSGLFIGGADYADQFAETLGRFKRGPEACQVAVGTLQAIGVGFDVPTVARGIIVAPVANSRNGRMQMQQYRGRFARTAAGKADAVLYYLLDVHVFGVGPLRNLARWNDVVKVWKDDRWVDARQYIKEHGNAEEERRSTFVE